MIPIYGDEDCEQLVFELFARAYPHEAAQQDWEKFFAFAKRQNPALTKEVCRQILERTK